MRPFFIVLSQNIELEGRDIEVQGFVVQKELSQEAQILAVKLFF
jgi:uncharacterized membrane protein YcgQ (UPF0703/DUF1980 family)